MNNKVPKLQSDALCGNPRHSFLQRITSCTFQPDVRQGTLQRRHIVRADRLSPLGLPYLKKEVIRRQYPLLLTSCVIYPILNLVYISIDKGLGKQPDMSKQCWPS